MIGRLLKDTDWAKATEYLSPAFFAVVPPLAMGRRIATLASSYADGRTFAKVCAEAATGLEALGVALDLDAPKGACARPLSAEREATVLRLYFWQLLHADTVLLDLRRVAFAGEAAGRLVWTPKPLYVRFDPDFAAAIRAMYRGFYGSQWRQFDRALSDLGLFHARDLLIAHFGASQSSMRFDLMAFRQTFHEVFVRCKMSGSRLHPDFLAFGAGLFGLYEHLERSGRSFNVRAAFESAAALGEGAI